jgi:hypothetical protein
VSRNSGALTSWNAKGLSRPVMELLYLYFSYVIISLPNNCIHKYLENIFIHFPFHGSAEQRYEFLEKPQYKGIQGNFAVSQKNRLGFCNVWMFWRYVYCTMTEVFLNLTEGFLILTEVFPFFFLSCKANARVKLAKTGHDPHTSTLVCICVVRLLFVLFYLLFVCKCVLLPGDNPIAVNKYNIFRI